MGNLLRKGSPRPSKPFLKNMKNKRKVRRAGEAMLNFAVRKAAGRTEISRDEAHRRKQGAGDLPIVKPLSSGATNRGIYEARTKKGVAGGNSLL